MLQGHVGEKFGKVEILTRNRKLVVEIRNFGEKLKFCSRIKKNYLNIKLFKYRIFWPGKKVLTKVKILVRN